MTKQQAISAKIVKLMDGGMEFTKAFNVVCGAGAYAALVHEVYHALRAKSVQA